ncbi:MAG: PEGA domain-containing protein, partial [Kiritimatiellia bacterium]
PGFFPKILEVELQDRTPVRVMAQLDSDAARLQVDSKPAGARVVLNNAMIGQTPHRHPRLGPGAHVLEVVKDGYTSYREEFTVQPGEERRVNVTLLPLPGRLEVNTVPAGARVYVDNQYQGEAPFVQDDLPAGTYVVSAELPGYARGIATAQVAQGSAKVLELRLERTSGTLLVSTEPPGVTVLLDGLKLGVTTARPGEQISEQLSLELVPEGERVIQFTRQGYLDATQVRNVTPGQTVIIHQKLTLRPVAFVPNVLIRTGTGPAYTFRGVLRERYANGDVMVELEPGVFRTFRAAEILEMETINPR